jgi:uncharacterized protein (DUF983 family)
MLVAISECMSANLELCPDCGQQVSKSAARCPHCGRDLHHGQQFAIGAVLGLLAMIIIGLLIVLVLLLFSH